jgi:DNA-binding CsgD family transcriptional regulator
MNGLTQREVACLELACIGIGPKEIAAILQISKRTVESHYRNAKRRMGAKTMAQLVYTSAQKGFICLSNPRKSFVGIDVRRPAHIDQIIVGGSL